MQGAEARKYPAWLQWLLKLIIFGAAVLIVSRRLSFENYEGIFAQEMHDPALLIPAFVILWMVNLFLDARIWQRVHEMLAPIGIKAALHTNLVCYALSFVTPVNSGELAGRYLMLDPDLDRRKAAFLTYWSHFPRLIVKLILGTGVAFLILIPYQDYGFMSLMMWVALSAIWIAGYLSFRKVQLWLSGRAWRRFSFGNYILPDKPIISEKIKLLILAMLKFLSYNLQFACLLLLWSDVALDLSLFISVVAMYIIGALVPTIPLTDFLVKAGVAFLVFDHAIISDSMLLNAALVTWFFNIALPSIAGGIIILRTNLLDALRKRPLPGNRYAP